MFNIVSPLKDDVNGELFYLTAKAAMKSAKGQPASRMDTCTAERPFAWVNIKLPSAKNSFFADGKETRFFWAVIRSAVLYSA